LAHPVQGEQALTQFGLEATLIIEVSQSFEQISLHGRLLSHCTTEILILESRPTCRCSPAKVTANLLDPTAADRGIRLKHHDETVGWDQRRFVAPAHHPFSYDKPTATETSHTSKLNSSHCTTLGTH